ncbi:Domain of uncharacterised function (DUF477) (plasmid) [Legionella adelaidensis]|uniref:Domain of uncharacterized function (DUF477) n=1 Tax=Legionella adelaidensis TaxID=45056 RepID=A0A0W0R0M8_9GAMM|nr:hypothetical protein [Legionella adelaidensis]KTC64542.1 hypothetical protein Lade_1836 [Legionella adelaidensis]VEH85909.1 Domain of uncharacterised function (DUF477) [Legionella adelaidensis]
MVKVFTEFEAKQIESAVISAEKETCAELVTVVLPISDRYVPEMMFFGFLMGSIIAFILWKLSWIVYFPQLFLIQLFFCLVFPYIGVTRLFVYFLPKKLLFHRAAHLGAEELLSVMQQVPPETPVLLLFVSQAEHYIHLFPNPIIKAKINDSLWDKIVNDLADKLKNKKLALACTETIQDIAKILTKFFPDDKGDNLYKDQIVH